MKEPKVAKGSIFSVKGKSRPINYTEMWGREAKKQPGFIMEVLNMSKNLPFRSKKSVR